MELSDILLDALVDSLKIFPFLFLTYCLMEFLERKSSLETSKYVTNTGRFAPLLGGIVGIIPQCGFSSVASNLYAGRVISVGTLLAVFLSTSDEMLPLFLSKGVSINKIIPLLLLKATIAALFGFVIDFIMHFFKKKEEINIDVICEREHCHCDEGSIFKAALYHSYHIFIYLLLFNVILGLIMSFADINLIASFLDNNPLLSHLLASLIGLIPNCAASVIISELYLSGLISFGSMMSGLLAGAGVGLFVLFKVNSNLKENCLIAITLCLVATFSGFIIDLFPLLASFF